MQKQLNADLFSPEARQQSRISQTGPNETQLGSQLLQIEQKLSECRRDTKRVSEQMGQLVDQVNASLKMVSQKMDKIQSYAQQNDVKFQSHINDQNEKITHLQSKVSERRIMELKMQELIDRHNTVLKNYEVKLAQLTKILAEKDQLLVQARSAINESKMEISRLKRL